jgi:exonuclease VII small subunit
MTARIHTPRLVAEERSDDAPLTVAEHLALTARDRIAELEALVGNLESERDHLITQRDTLGLKNKMLRDQIAQMQPVQDVAAALDRLNNWLCGEALKTEARLSAAEQSIRQIAAAGELR